ncbi:hypothetical protein Ssa13956_06670 [Streptococcus salivarius]
MQEIEQKPSALPKKKTGWGEGEINKNGVTIGGFFVPYNLSKHSQASKVQTW